MREPLTPAEAEARVRESIEILDAMFDDPGLNRLRLKTSDHPAVRRRDTLAAMFPRRQRPYEELVMTLIELGAIEFDRFWLPAPDAAEFWSFIPSAKAADRVRQNIANPKTFDETLAEVRTWDHLRRKGGLEAELIEEAGKPDIVVNRGTESEVWVEAKFVHFPTGDRAVTKALQKANEQLRSASKGGAGVAYLS
jgi:hypothetical protein